MYILYKIDGAQVKLELPEKSFLENVERNFLEVMKLFERYDLSAGDFKICPTSKGESEWMMRVYCTMSESHQHLPAWLTRHFVNCFELILIGTPPAKALGLKNPPHRPKESKVAERNIKIHSEMSNLMQQGIKFYEASLEVSEIYNLHESHIQNIYSAVKKSLENKLPFLGTFDIPF